MPHPASEPGGEFHHRPWKLCVVPSMLVVEDRGDTVSVDDRRVDRAAELHAEGAVALDRRIAIDLDGDRAAGAPGPMTSVPDVGTKSTPAVADPLAVA